MKSDGYPLLLLHHRLCSDRPSPRGACQAARSCRHDGVAGAGAHSRPPESRGGLTRSQLLLVSPRHLSLPTPAVADWRLRRSACRGSRTGGPHHRAAWRSRAC